MRETEKVRLCLVESHEELWAPFLSCSDAPHTFRIVFLKHFFFPPCDTVECFSDVWC